jgi:exodeoxyribonuclease III
MKIVSWNVNSIRKGVENDLNNLIESECPDVICFQETKATGYDAEKYFANNIILEKYPYRYWNDSISGQAGVSIWSNKKPTNIIKDIPRLYKLKEGRIIIIEFEDITILNTYVPNTGRGKIAEDNRNVWHNSIINWLSEQFEKDKLLVWCGDLERCGF